MNSTIVHYCQSNLDPNMQTQCPAVSTNLLLIIAPPHVENPSKSSGSGYDRIMTIQGLGLATHPLTIRTDSSDFSSFGGGPPPEVWFLSSMAWPQISD